MKKTLPVFAIVVVSALRLNAGTLLYQALPASVSTASGYTSAVDGGNARGTDRVINGITLYSLKTEGDRTTADSCTLNAAAVLMALADKVANGDNTVAAGGENAGGDEGVIEGLVDQGDDQVGVSGTGGAGNKTARTVKQGTGNAGAGTGGGAKKGKGRHPGGKGNKGTGAQTTQSGVSKVIRDQSGENAPAKSGKGAFNQHSDDKGNKQQRQQQRRAKSTRTPISNAVLSDLRMKKDVSLVGWSPKGIPIYQFSYINQPNKRYQGTIAQAIARSRPDAIIWRNGIMWVDYSRLDVRMEELPPAPMKGNRRLNPP